MKTVNRADSDGGWLAFSLVELLVVTAIVAMLVALVLPALAHSREKSKKASCQAVLRQVYLLTRVYADDHEGEMPLLSALFPSGQFPYCPGSPRSQDELSYGGYYGGYSWIPYYWQQGREKVKIDPQWVLVGDRRPWHDPNRTWEPPPIRMWNGRHNLLYGDGHLAWIQLSSPP
jgi:prepilin-type processing-associated H-X9-DG protein